MSWWGVGFKQFVYQQRLITLLENVPAAAMTG
jgi:hypothetical protein